MADTTVQARAMNPTLPSSPQHQGPATGRRQGLTKLSPDTDQIEDYKQEYTSWFNVLSRYHIDRFDRNYRQYTAFTETQGTRAKISDPMAPELIERVIQKLWENDPKFLVQARGQNLPREVTEIMSSLIDFYWTSPDRVQSTGPMKAKLKMVGREFLVTGNVAVESFYNSESDTPDMRLIPIEDVIFDPTRSLRSAPVHYVRQYLSVDEFRDLAEVKDKDGKTVGGLFDAAAVERVITSHLSETDDDKDTYGPIKPTTISNRINRAGSGAYQDYIEDILLVTRYEGPKVCRIADWQEVVQEYENTVLDDDPLDFAMDIEVPKQPYGFSMLDFINGLTHAKDLILNQVIDYGSKALNPPLFVDPTIGALNMRTVRNAFKVGGVVYAAPNQAAHQPMSPLPPAGFELLNYLQQRGESNTGIGAYLSGVPNQANDTTKGTKGGIEALIQQAVSPIHDRQVNLEESIIEPMVNKWLKMTAAVMGSNEERYALMSGQAPRWVKLTKGMLTGKIMLDDLLTAGLITQSEVPEFLALKTTQGQQEKQDPNYQYNSDKEPAFEVDWVVRVEAGSMAERDMAKEIENLQQWTQFRLQFRIPTDVIKVSETMALRMGIRDPQQYDLTPDPNNPNQPGKGLPFIMPKESIKFEDLPPAGKIQLAGQAGIELTPADVAEYPPAPGTDVFAHTGQQYYPMQQQPGQPGPQAAPPAPGPNTMPQGQSSLMSPPPMGVQGPPPMPPPMVGNTPVELPGKRKVR